MSTIHENLLLHTREGIRVSGRARIAEHVGHPLLVCVHGGSYNSAYFDVPGHSLLDRAAANGFDIVALDRPNYGDSDKLPGAETTFARNAAILDAAIEHLWLQMGEAHPGVVLVGHSIGGAIAVHMAAGTERSWPLCGISVTAVNTLSPDHIVAAWHSVPAGTSVTLSAEQRRRFMYGSDETFDAEVIERTALSTEAVPVEELLEIVGKWVNDFEILAKRIDVPVHYTLPEHDGLWVSSVERVDEFARAFTATDFIDASLSAGVGHNVDHHRLGIRLHQAQLSFAARCGEPAQNAERSR
ncbi:alpha/beta hydrolase [Streptomyces malaysiensis]|uniref:alpha/beta hydrolase n=1 Tax=Streptomyces malaysiensis TaxID=92644 RepID=UPI002B2CE32E|nr:alpha/beta fold hydrolase [Streptomyces malaysiensis]